MHLRRGFDSAVCQEHTVFITATQTANHVVWAMGEAGCGWSAFRVAAACWFVS